MSGNVAELTLSCWSDTHLGIANDSAYLAAALAQGSCRRVAKGGSFTDGMYHLRPACRTRPTEDMRRDWMGFRVVGELDATSG